MAAFSTFLRNTPRHLLKRVFEQIDGPLPADLDWTAPRAEFVRMMVETIGLWEASLQARIYRTADRISDMVDEVGQTALRSVVVDRLAFDELSGGYERAITLFLNHPERFRQAEEVRFTDAYRIGRLWTGFEGEVGLDVLCDDGTLATFKDEIGVAFDSPQVHIDVFERMRPTFESDPDHLVQVSIYREGRPDEEDVFLDGELARTTRRPVIEAAITYNKRTGVTELVGPELKKRVQLAKLFTERLLNSTFTNRRIPSRLYDLEPLRNPQDFTFDTRDGIEGVSVVMLQLSPLRGGGQRLTIEIPPSATPNIWAMMATHFDRHDPLQMAWVIEQVRLIIRFLPRDGQKKGRVLPVTIRGTDRCDLKGRNHDEQLISQKYLRQWKILKDNRG